MTKEPAPGDGIKSLRTSAAFKALNFELYAKPNKVIIAFGLVAIFGTVCYIAYMRRQYEGMGYYSAIAEDGKEVFIKKKSKWDS